MIPIERRQFLTDRGETVLWFASALFAFAAAWLSFTALR